MTPEVLMAVRAEELRVEIEMGLWGLVNSAADGASSIEVRVLAGRSVSVAVLVTLIVVSSSIVRSGCAGSTGGLLISLITTVKLLVALKGGAPLSVTIVVIRLVLGP